MSKISVIIPVLRTKYLPEIIKSVEKDAFEVLTDDGQEECVEKVNRLAAKSKGDTILYILDRTVLQEGWKQKIEDNLKDGIKVINFHTNNIEEGLMTKEFYNYLGYFFYPGYIHYWADMELGEIARRAQVYREVSIVKKIYDKGLIDYSTPQELVDQDTKLYYHRASNEFKPLHWEK